MQGVIHGCDIMMRRSREELLEVELVKPNTPDRIREVAGGAYKGDGRLLGIIAVRNIESAQSFAPKAAAQMKCSSEYFL